jgi:hypothetical protein
MSCVRCGGARTEPVAPIPMTVRDVPRWCEKCERDYDAWSRNHATDIVWTALGGMVVIIVFATIIPLLGVPWVFATTGIVGASATILGIHRWNRNRRRMQFLQGAAVPRAYLPDKSS